MYVTMPNCRHCLLPHGCSWFTISPLHSTALLQAQAVPNGRHRLVISTMTTMITVYSPPLNGLHQLSHSPYESTYYICLITSMAPPIVSLLIWLHLLPQFLYSSIFCLIAYLAPPFASLLILLHLLPHCLYGSTFCLIADMAPSKLRSKPAS